MNKHIFILYLCLFGLNSILVMVYLAKVHSFFRYLRDNDPKTWEDLGKPHLFLSACHQPKPVPKEGPTRAFILLDQIN